MEADQHLSGPSGLATWYDPTAVIGKRVVATIVDLLIDVVIGFLPFWMILTSMHTVHVADSSNYCGFHSTTGRLCFPLDGTTALVASLPAAWWTALSAAKWIVFAWVEGRYGWTPGKLAVGVRVVRDTTGGPCGFGRAIIRSLLWIVDGLFFGLIAFVTANGSRGHRRLGDRAAGTLVVDRAAFGVVPDPRIVQEPAMLPAMVPASPLPLDQPVWDAARGAYIQYDSAQSAWLEFDDQAQRWKPIST